MTAGTRGRSAWPAAVVFDFDGTLVDSLPDLTGGLAALLGECGLAPLAAAEVRTMIGHGARTLVQRAFAARGQDLAGNRLTAVTERFVMLYGPRATVETRPYPHVAATVRSLAAAGVALGICTNKPTAITRDILRAVGLAEAIRVVVGGDFEGLPVKPDPAPLRRTLELLEAAPDSAVMVGDSSSDVGAARAAGLPVLLVAGGYTATPAAELGADGVLPDFSALPAALAALARERAS